MKEIKDYYSQVIAVVFSVATAIAMSSGIVPFIDLMLPMMTFIPGAAAMLWTALFASVMCWSAASYNGIYSIVSQSIQPQSAAETAKEIYDESEKILEKFQAYASKAASADIEREAALGALHFKVDIQTTQAKTLYSTLHSSHQKILSKSGIASSLYRFIVNSALGPYIPHMYTMNLQKERMEICEALLHHMKVKHAKTDTDPGIDAKPSDDPTIGAYIETTLAKLPMSPFERFSKLAVNSISQLTTKLYAVFTNTTSFVMFGALPIIGLVPMSTLAAYMTITLFGLVGFVSANSLERTVVDENVQLQATLSDRSQKWIQKLRESAPRISYLNMSITKRDLLARLIAISASIGNFMGAVALVEAMTTASILNEAAVSAAMFNPLAASTLSISFGILAAVSTFYTLTNLMLTTQQTLPTLDAPNYQNTSRKQYAKLYLSNLGATCMGIATRAVCVGQAITSYLTLHFLPAIILAGVMTFAGNVYVVYKQDAYHTLTNIMFTIGLVLNISAAAIMSGISGSIYHKLFGPIAGKVMGGFTFAAQAEHLPSIFLDGAKTFDKVIHTPEESIPASKKLAAAAA